MRKDECLFCSRRKCNNRVAALDRSYDEIACWKHGNELNAHADKTRPGVMKIYSSSTGNQVRGDDRIFKMD